MNMETLSGSQDLVIESEMMVEMYRRMLLIRKFEEAVFDVYRRGWMPGLGHLSDGQEATAVGVCSALRQDDHQHPPRSRPHYRQGRSGRKDDGRSDGQSHRLLPR